MRRPARLAAPRTQSDDHPQSQAPQVRGRVCGAWLCGASRSLAVTLLLLASSALPLAMPEAHAAADSQRRLHRAAYVLRQLAPDEGWERVGIPSRINLDDQASALLHHTDKLFVFLSLARDLEVLDSEGVPLAAHFAAHAYRLAGKNPEAARSMRRHVRKAPFKSQDRLFLLQRLYELRRYTDLREEAFEWERLDGACREERMRYVWGSYIAQGLYHEALDSARFSACPGWLAPLLAARARYLLGEEQEAMAGVAAISRRFPGDAQEISALWRELASSRAYP